MENALISDFDGTITRTDFYALVAERFMPEPRTDYLQLYRNGAMSHFEAMASYFSHTPADDESIAALLRDTQPDPRLRDAFTRLNAASWEVVIVSAGSSWYIDRILAAAGVQVTVHSNPGRLEPGRGLVLERATASPFYCAGVGVDKAAVVRDARRRCRRVAFAGDGPPDVEAALLVDADLRFARADLAAALSRRGERYRHFEQWSEIADALVRCPAL